METPRKQYLTRLEALRQERSNVEPDWRDLADYIRPHTLRLYGATDLNRSRKREKIINSTPTFAARVLASGMMAGITSPARSWFRLTTPDPELAEAAGVRTWLHLVEQRLRQAFTRSKIYNALFQVYEDLGTPGTAAMIVEDDHERMMRAHVFPTGQYFLSLGETQQVDTCAREFNMSVRQVVRRFTLERCSAQVQDMFRRQHFEQMLPIVHFITPNDAYEHGRAGPRGMRWKSCWMEKNADDNAGFLKESGYEEFPLMAPRWSVTGEDTYATESPGMVAIGDSKALQVLERRKGQAVDKIVNPPMRGPGSMMHQRRASLAPGEWVFSDATNAGAAVAPAMDINPNAITVVGMELREHERRIKSAYFADLWLALTQSEGTMTAREIAERHEEKMLQLGPVMERLEDELLDPLVDRAFGILQRNGHLPPPPQEMQGMEIKVEYISIMAQAQKMLGTSGIERVVAFAGNLAAAKQDPSVFDKLDTDQTIDEYALMLGVPPDVIRSDEAVEQIRQQRAQQMAEAQQAEMAAQVPAAAKTLSETDVEGDNALTRVLGTLGGRAAAGTGIPQ